MTFSSIDDGLANPASTIMKSLQRLTVAFLSSDTTVDVTITTVDKDNSRLYLHHQKAGSSSPDNRWDKNSFRFEWIDNSTIRISRTTSGEDYTLYFQVQEFIPGVITVQRSTITLANSSAAQTKAVSSASTTLSEIGWLGFTTDYNDKNADNVFARIRQNSTTEIEALRGASSGEVVLGYEMITYSSTYVHRAENISLAIAANELAAGSIFAADVFDKDVMATWCGQALNTSNTDYINDLAMVVGTSRDQIIAARTTANSNAAGTMNFNRIVWKDGVIRRKWTTDLYGNTLVSISVDNLFFGDVAANKYTANWLGFRNTSGITKSSGNIIDDYATGLDVFFPAAYVVRTAGSGSKVCRHCYQGVEWV